MRRLEAMLGRYDLAALDLAARVTCIPGDLAQPRLGLAPDAFERLAARSTRIIHSGASVNFVFPYEALKAATSPARTRSCASRPPRARVFTTSRRSACSPAGRHHLAPVLETALPTEPDQLALGYMRAKWVAEELVVQARARGLDVSIYRPGTIAGHARTGAFNPDDFVCALIKGCIQLGSRRASTRRSTSRRSTT